MATVEDVHALAAALPGVDIVEGSAGRPIYSVRGKSFVFFRNPRPDAVDPATGERFADVICLWTETLEDKQALVEDPTTPFFTTPHFDGYRAVLVRESRLHEIGRTELAEVITDAWLARAPKRMAAAWLAEHPPVE